MLQHTKFFLIFVMSELPLIQDTQDILKFLKISEYFEFNF